jgi:hypothetical protein
MQGKSKSTMAATLNNEKEEKVYSLITIIYEGGAKIDVVVEDFEVQRDENSGVIVSYQFSGVNIELFQRLSKYVRPDNLVFTPLSLGKPETMVAVFTSPIFET